ncbi:putative sodium-dependent multivitamin transporter [Drosophila persimilis]|uniref:Sodium-dependent multivitamin transporter n=1 Tax=Drosophila pseudoobscura pseudoobscura TaxID=46245 RepID=A0A6I8V5D6_DROPS|nr:putative sodium-dependent multivitamin transporter [Drosophila pseudoobscura]XP_026849903.1 putative sodium-dependent multivitamin transporter [Drosophila persimilis]
MEATLGAWDYAILAVVLIISVLIGLYYRFAGKRQSTTTEYLLAGRSMGVTPVAFSLMASFMSAITILGVSMENYQFGTMFVIINLSYVVSTPIAAYLILPVFYRLKTASVYEYLELRFGYATRLAASVSFSLQMILYMGIVVYAPALALEAVTGVNQIFSIVIVGVVCTFYATIGGMKAVLVTDIYQSVLMFVAVFSVIICAWVKAGSLGEIWRTAQENGRIDFTNFSVDPTERHTWFTQILGGCATYLAIYGVNQAQVQRLLAVRNLSSARAALWWCLPILCLLSLSTCFSGLCIYWYYRDCDPVLEGRVNSRDQVMPLFVVDTMGEYTGLAGLFVSGIFCASLSTISSIISSLAAVTLEDYLKPLYKCCSSRGGTLTDRQTLWYSKLLSVFYGLLCIGLAFMAGSIGGLLQAALSIFGIVGGPLLGLFTLGMYVTSANQKGAIGGLLISLVLCFWIGFGQPRPPLVSLPMSTEGCPIDRTYARDAFFSKVEEQQQDEHYFYLYRISYMWYAALGFLVAFFGGWLLSWLCALLRWDDNRRIYQDAECTMIKHDLFVPPLAKRLQRRQMPRLVVTGTSSEIGGIAVVAPPRLDQIEWERQKDVA